jgi:predicted small secreted protein
MKKILIALAVGMMVLTLTACETMKGLGKDVEDAGEWVQKKAS